MKPGQCVPKPLHFKVCLGIIVAIRAWHIIYVLEVSLIFIAVKAGGKKKRESIHLCKWGLVGLTSLPRKLKRVKWNAHTHQLFFSNFSQDKIFLDTICQEENLPRFTDCCAKKDPERNDCFLSLKNSSRAFISPFERPNAEAACKNYSQNQHSLTG